LLTDAPQRKNRLISNALHQKWHLLEDSAGSNVTSPKRGCRSANPRKLKAGRFTDFSKGAIHPNDVHRGYAVNRGIPPEAVAAVYGRPISEYRVHPGIIAGTRTWPGAVVVRPEDIRNPGRLREFTRQSVIGREVSRIAPGVAAPRNGGRGWPRIRPRMRAADGPASRGAARKLPECRVKLKVRTRRPVVPHECGLDLTRLKESRPGPVRATGAPPCRTP
jgi:hypothetical protein